LQRGIQEDVGMGDHTADRTAGFPDNRTGTKDRLSPGTRVDVRDRYVGAWSRGFEVAEKVNADGYRVRRVSDGSILPEPMSGDEIRPERRKQGLWWN
jgi:hypothetical protein